MDNIIDFDIEKGFPLVGLSLVDIAKFTGGQLIGNDQPIYYLARLKVRRKNQDHFLTYVTNAQYWEEFLNSHHHAAIVDRNTFAGKELQSGKSIILVDKPADYVFFALQEYLAKNNFYAKLKPYRGSNCAIHPSVQIFDNVVINDSIDIGPNVVIYPNTVIGSDSLIKANTVIGGTGFEFKYLNGKKKIVTHTGGVYIGENVEIGSLTTIDRDLMGYFTIIMDGAKIDNQVHVAHNCYIGEDCSIIASSEIGGSSIFGKGVWYAAQACCNPEIEFGDYAFVGTGSFVGKNVPSFAQVIGNPARQIAWICKCQKYTLSFEDDNAVCRCGRTYKKESGAVILISDVPVQK